MVLGLTLLSPLSQQKTVLLQQEISRIMHENNQLHAALLHSNEVTAEHQQRLQRETKEMEVPTLSVFEGDGHTN